MSKTNNFENKKIVLDRDLNFESELSYFNYEDNQYGDINEDGTVSNLLVELTSRKGFTPIKQFCGQFEGNNKIISNLYEDRGEEIAGLFDSMTGTVQNLGIKNVVLSGGTSVGTIAAYANTIVNCYIEGNVNFKINLRS